ncbi:MAG: WYL domain-containing protein [Bacteroidetes bacterium]|nr:WYL domain-containing protein [Bacteroidota bacterium]
MGISKRTFQRDIQDIRKLFGVDIEYSALRKGYFIRQNENESMNFQKVIESFELFDSLKLANDVSRYISIEKKSNTGLENIYGLLHATRNRFKMEVYYQKFWSDSSELRKVEPLALKEFKNRWYLIAFDSGDSIIKCFGLDRISGLMISRDKFAYPKDFDLDQHFLFSFGIIALMDDKPKNIELSLTPFKGNISSHFHCITRKKLKLIAKRNFVSH